MESIVTKAETMDSGQLPESLNRAAIRVELGLLDRLMDLAGELVLSRNQLIQGIHAGNLEGMKSSGQRIDMITSELQEAIMKTRNLTNAIIPCQMVLAGKERFALPQDNLSELVRIPGNQIKDTIERIGNAEVLRLRGEILPLLNLSEILGIEKRYFDPRSGEELVDRRQTLADRRSKQHVLVHEYGEDNTGDSTNGFIERSASDRRGAIQSLHIAVVTENGFKYGMVVEDFLEPEEIVVKSMGRHFETYQAYAGATIMGDGKVALILDVLNLARMAGLSLVSEEAKAMEAAGKSIDLKEDSTGLLTFRQAETEYFAVPLDVVQRIERVRASDIEQIGTRKVVKYRGGVLELFDLSQILDIAPLPARGLQEIIVFHVGGRDLGLMVTGPVDALEMVLEMDETTLKQTGISGSVTISRRTTLIVDVAGLERSLILS